MKQRYGIIGIGLFVVVGLVLIGLSRAATAPIVLEPEKGTIANTCARATADTTASGGSYIKFGCQAPAATTLLDKNFNNWPTGTVSSTFWNGEMGGNSGGGSNLEDTSVVERAAGDKAVRAYLQANTIRSTPSGNNGSAMFIPLAPWSDEVTMQYDVRFVGTFDWGWGGKLPGVAGVRSGVTPGWPSGGNFAGDDGWSVRVMWNTPGSYPGNAQSPNEGLGYFYGKGQKERYGDNLWWDKSFVANKWHTIKMHIKLNDPGVANGQLQMWLDGAPALTKTNLLYRSRSDVRVSHIYWHVFRGGATLDWAAKVDGYVDIDNMKITTP